MKKRKIKKQFIEELAKIPIVNRACDKFSISRNSVYRWRKEDSSFAKEMDEAMQTGVDYLNDFSETQLVSLMHDKEFKAISFWLKHRHENYKVKTNITVKATIKDKWDPNHPQYERTFEDLIYESALRRKIQHEKEEKLRIKNGLPPTAKKESDEPSPPFVYPWDRKKQE